MPDNSLIPILKHIKLATEAYFKHDFKSIRQAAAAFDVPKSTLIDRIRGVRPLQESQIRNQKLTPVEELALVEWVLSMDERGMPPSISYARYIANTPLAGRGLEEVRKN